MTSFRPISTSQRSGTRNEPQLFRTTGLSDLVALFYTGSVIERGNRTVVSRAAAASLSEVSEAAQGKSWGFQAPKGDPILRSVILRKQNEPHAHTRSSNRSSHGAYCGRNGVRLFVCRR